MTHTCCAERAKRSKPLSTHRLFIAAGLMALQLACASAQSAEAGTAPKADSVSVAGRYPAGSIKSVEAADAALEDLSKERSEIEARYTAEEQACHPKFFATSCVDQAKERRRQALMQLRKVELEANSFKRQERVRERDKAAADRQAKEQADRLERERAQQEKESKRDDAPQAEPPEAARNVQTTIFPDRSEQHEAKMKRLQEEDRANEKKRAENVAEYEKKVQAAQERQKKIAQRKAEKEEKRRAKQAPLQAPQPAAQ